MCGVGEQVIREAMVVESAKLIRMRMWGGCGSVRGLVLEGVLTDVVMRGSSCGRPVVVR